ncbi:MAG: peptidoglycan-binding protein [Parasporobacterium sp.]|nr:peptidoglycan-binding protein [Parasporobacterium sp.]
MRKKVLFVSAASALAVCMCSPFAAQAGTLSYGMYNDSVMDLQASLAAFGYFDEDVTGYFGDVTQGALIAFQSDYGLETDGIAGPITAAYLGISISSYGEDSDEYGYEDDSTYYDGSSASLSRTLAYGDEGDDVYLLQELLFEYGFFYSIPTGVFGEFTEAAVTAFQSYLGLDADGVVGPVTIAALYGDTGSASSYSSASMENYVDSVISAAYSTPTTGAGYCAAWVSQVLSNAGVLTYNPCNLRSSVYSYAVTSGLADSWYSYDTGWNANDYWAYVCTSSDVNDLQPGMVVASRSTYTYLGSQFGHVGIYLGDGQVISSNGSIDICSLDEWYQKYNNSSLGSTVAWGYMPY